jgi:alkylmercury lyase
MRDIPLQDIITAHTDTADTNQLEEFLPLLQFFRLRGSGPGTPERLATAMRLSPSEVETLLQSSSLVVGPDGNIHMPPGPHQIYADGETFAGWCALDTLLFPLLIGQAARVVSTCPATGRQIRLTVTAQGTVADLDPASTVVSLRLPDETTTASNAEETICAYGHFFVDREHTLSWPDLHPEAVLLSVEDAFHPAREIANVSRTYAEKAEI